MARVHVCISEKGQTGMTKILLVFGTRPEAIKVAPVYHALKSVFDVEICLTAQHREMLDQVMEIFGMTADHDLDIMSADQNLTQVTTRVLEGLRTCLLDSKPDYVFVHGDTTTSMAASIAAFYRQIPVCHIEAGLRTGDIYSPYPEEMNRRITGAVATKHFAPTPLSRENLMRENVDPDNIFVTGNTAIDALMMTIESPRVRALESLFTTPGRKILVTAHRRENFGEPMENICRAVLEIIDRNPGSQVVFPVHYNPNVRKVVGRLLEGRDAVTLIDPVGYDLFVKLQADADLIITDSGGVQEEAPSLGKPVLVMRECTERPEAVAKKTVLLVGTSTRTIADRATALLTDADLYESMARAVNPYGDGKAADRIRSYMECLSGLKPWDDLADPFDDR